MMKTTIKTDKPTTDQVKSIKPALDVKRALDMGWDSIRIEKEMRIQKELIEDVEADEYWWLDNLLDKGYVRLVDWMGDELAVVNAARASFAKESYELSTNDARLIKFLGEHGHFSVFRHNFITVEIKAPLEITRQWWKYVTGGAHTDSFSTAWNEACFSGDQKIKTWSGYTTTVEKLYKWYQNDINEQTSLRSVDEDGNIVKNSVTGIWKSGKKKVYRVTSELGFTVDTTDDHRYLTPDGYKELKDLSSGDLIMMNGIPAVHHALMRAHPVAIKSIEYIGEMDVYDIEMENEPNLVVDQFVVHNSRRYVTMEPEFYIPEKGEWRSAPDDKKQGSGGPIDPGTGSLLSDELEAYCEEGKSKYQWAIEDLGVAPEIARLFLPAYGMYTVWRWSTSLQGIAFFLSQRKDEGAQSEIQQYANKLDLMINRLYPLSLSALMKGLTGD